MGNWFSSTSSANQKPSSTTYNRQRYAERIAYSHGREENRRENPLRKQNYDFFSFPTTASSYHSAESVGRFKSYKYTEDVTSERQNGTPCINKRIYGNVTTSTGNTETTNKSANTRQISDNKNSKVVSPLHFSDRYTDSMPFISSHQSENVFNSTKPWKETTDIRNLGESEYLERRYTDSITKAVPTLSSSCSASSCQKVSVLNSTNSKRGTEEINQDLLNFPPLTKLPDVPSTFSSASPTTSFQSGNALNSTPSTVKTTDINKQNVSAYLPVNHPSQSYSSITKTATVSTLSSTSLAGSHEKERKMETTPGDEGKNLNKHKPKQYEAVLSPKESENIATRSLLSSDVSLSDVSLRSSEFSDEEVSDVTLPKGYDIDFDLIGYEDDTKYDLYCHLTNEFEEYDENMCKLVKNPLSLCFRECTIGSLIGSSHTYVDQIERVTNVDLKDKYFTKDNIKDEVVITLPEKCTLTEANEIKGMYTTLLKGQFYRHQAYFYNDRRTHYLEMALDIEVEFGRRSSYLHRVNRIRFKYGEKTTACHKLAESFFFKFCNIGRGLDQIDLHYLLTQYENEKTREKRLERNEKYNKNFTRWEGEAELRLKERLTKLEKMTETERPNTLEIIVGAGNNSKSRQQKLRPGIEKYLKSTGQTFIEANKGSLLIEMKRYEGHQPCFGCYYCKICNRSWTSDVSWVDNFQLCYKCESICYSFKHQEKSNAPRRRRNNNDSSLNCFFKEHTEICGKCLQLGKDCRSES